MRQGTTLPSRTIRSASNLLRWYAEGSDCPSSNMFSVKEPR